MRRAPVLLSALLLTGCGAGAGEVSSAGPGTAAVRHHDGTVVLVPADDPRGGADALTGGTLVRLEGGCLGLSTAGQEGGLTQLVRWPYGTTWDPEREELSVARLQPGGDRGVVRLGDDVSLGGGTWGGPPASSGCTADRAWSAS